MKKEIFEDFKVFENRVENLKKENRFFFANYRELSIITNESHVKENESFLSFYLNILIIICEHQNNELTNNNTTKWYLYVSKSFLEYSKKDLETMLDKLGYNFDDYDFEITDKVGIFY